MSTLPQRATAYYPALTGLRAVAAALVYFYHFNPFKGHGQPVAPLTELFGAVLGTGIGLNIFFVMSGFVITTRYVGQVELSLAWGRQYMLNRFARIYPLYFLLTALTFAAMAGHLLTWYTFGELFTVRDKVVAVVANLTLTRAFFQSFYFVGVPTAWSLTVEESFYASAPFMLLLLRRRAWLLPVLALGIVGVGGGLTLIATRWQLYAGFMQPFSFVLQFTYFGRCVEFLAGIGLALWLRKRGHAPARRGTTLLGIGLIIWCATGHTFVHWPTLQLPDWAAELSASLVFNCPLSASIVVLFHGLIHEDTWLRKLLSTKPLDLLGKSTYAFYLIHVGLFADLLQKAFGLHIIAFFLFFYAVAVLLYKLVEQPAHTAILRRFRTAPAP
ncbi:acyltransferase family protein [Hymenobacter rubidus]|uniref:acyltransferase family protein n=1 Tax=Hymenobacter rubidus TaxID=1441626 RepID=UPI00191FB5F5|nr:acyltransferase [Hymenobacter rubidus]